ncbi:MAG TPA: riboflavin synthase [Hanamia sp.]|nr:riboflavin synthase [Hanamia sp.]
MFTGIIEAFGEVKDIAIEQSNYIFYIKSELSSHLKIDESVSHNGICLTVEDIKNDTYRVTAINETLQKTNAGTWKPGDFINLERSMKLNDRLDGHIVQGHVDDTGICTSKKDKEGSVEFTFKFNKIFAPLIIEKGSICVNGVSLTAFNVTENNFTVAIIPYTFLHTNFHYLEINDSVNLEFDILGKYVARIAKISHLKEKQ